MRAYTNPKKTTTHRFFPKESGVTDPGSGLESCTKKKHATVHRFFGECVYRNSKAHFFEQIFIRTE